MGCMGFNINVHTGAITIRTLNPVQLISCNKKIIRHNRTMWTVLEMCSYYCHQNNRNWACHPFRPLFTVTVTINTMLKFNGDTRLKNVTYQWRIQDFPEVGEPALGGLPTYDFAQFSQKTAWTWKNLDRGRGSASKILLCKSATAYKQTFNLFNIMCNQRYTTVFNPIR